METVQEFFKSIDGITYIIYVFVLVLFILALIGYADERKIRELKKDEKEKEKAMLEYENCKKLERNETITGLPELEKSNENTYVNVQAVQQIQNNNSIN